MRENEAIELLGRKIADEGYLTIPQVRNTTGFDASRTADALLVQTWPSRGLSITGVEYKCSRGDWRRELKNGAKAETIAEYCHYWLVLAPKGIVRITEVPIGWGLWEFDDARKLFRTKRPPAQQQVKPLDMGFLAAVMRAAEKVNRFDPALAAARLDLEKGAAKHAEEEIKRRTRHYENLLEQVKTFEDASGLSITRSKWSTEKLGAGLQRYLRDPDLVKRQIEGDRDRLKQLLESMNDVI